MKTIKTDMKKNLEGSMSSLNEREEHVSELEDRVVDITDNEEKKEGKETSDTNNHTNIHITVVPEGEERGKGAEYIFEDTGAEKFPLLGSVADIQVQRALVSPNLSN